MANQIEPVLSYETGIQLFGKRVRVMGADRGGAGQHASRGTLKGGDRRKAEVLIDGMKVTQFYPWHCVRYWVAGNNGEPMPSCLLKDQIGAGNVLALTAGRSIPAPVSVAPPMPFPRGSATLPALPETPLAELMSSTPAITPTLTLDDLPDIAALQREVADSLKAALDSKAMMEEAKADYAKQVDRLGKARKALTDATAKINSLTDAALN